MNIYQRMVLVSGAIAFIFVLLTAPTFVSVRDGNTKLKFNATDARDNRYHEIDVPRLVIREIIIVTVTALVFFALRQFGDLSRFKKLSRWKYVVLVIILLVLATAPITLSVLINYKIIHRSPTITNTEMPTETKEQRRVRRRMEFEQRERERPQRILERNKRR